MKLIKCHNFLLVDGVQIVDTEDDIVGSSNVTSHRKRRSKIYSKSGNCTDDSKSDVDIICSQGKLQELKENEMSRKKAKVPSAKKTIRWSRSKVQKENNETDV